MCYSIRSGIIVILLQGRHCRARWVFVPFRSIERFLKFSYSQWLGSLNLHFHILAIFIIYFSEKLFFLSNLNQFFNILWATRRTHNAVPIHTSFMVIAQCFLYSYLLCLPQPWNSLNLSRWFRKLLRWCLYEDFLEEYHSKALWKFLFSITRWRSFCNFLDKLWNHKRNWNYVLKDCIFTSRK